MLRSMVRACVEDPIEVKNSLWAPCFARTHSHVDEVSHLHGGGDRAKRGDQGDHRERAG